jgi:glycosyltransferase 2 family protein
LTTNADAGPAQRRRRLLTAVLGLLITAALLYWVLRGISLQQVLQHLGRARKGPLLLSVAIATFTFVIRTIRWRSLLRAPDGGPLPFLPLWHATAMGFMANNTTPFRLGELLRTYAASRLGRVPMTAALSSIAVERALDGLTLLGMLGVGLLGAGLPADTLIGGNRLDALARKSAIVCAIIFAGALFVVLFPVLTERLMRALVPVKSVADRLVRLVEGLRLGFAALRSPALLAAAVSWSILHWLLGALSFYVAFAAFGIDVGFAGAMLVQSILAFGLAAQLTPGYFGQFELVVAAVLALFGVPNDLAVAYGLTYHITTFLPIVLLGLLSLSRTGLHVRDAKAAM